MFQISWAAPCAVYVVGSAHAPGAPFWTLCVYQWRLFQYFSMLQPVTLAVEFISRTNRQEVQQLFLHLQTL